MIQAKCIQKFKDKQGRIYGYRLVDINGQTQDVTPGDLKLAIRDKRITVINLALTSDNRLIDKKEEKQLQNTKIMPNKVVAPQPSKKEKFEECVEAIMKELTKTVGSGDIQIEPDDNSDDYLLATIYGLYYDDDDEMYGVTFAISNKKIPEAYIALQKDCMDDPEFEYTKFLTRPMESKDNLLKIKELFSKFYNAFKNWTDKKKAESDADELEDLLSDAIFNSKFGKHNIDITSYGSYLRCSIYDFSVPVDFNISKNGVELVINEVHKTGPYKGSCNGKHLAELKTDGIEIDKLNGLYDKMKAVLDKNK